MAENRQNWGSWAKEVPNPEGTNDRVVLGTATLGDLRLALAALFCQLQRLGDYPEEPLLEMHAAADRLKATIAKLNVRA